MGPCTKDRRVQHPSRDLNTVSRTAPNGTLSLEACKTSITSGMVAWRSHLSSPVANIHSHKNCHTIGKRIEWWVTHFTIQFSDDFIRTSDSNLQCHFEDFKFYFNYFIWILLWIVLDCCPFLFVLTIHQHLDSTTCCALSYMNVHT